jgi:hypothetical protein
MPDSNGRFKGITVPTTAKWPPARPPRKTYTPPADTGTKTGRLKCSNPNTSTPPADQANKE